MNTNIHMIIHFNINTKTNNNNANSNMNINMHIHNNKMNNNTNINMNIHIHMKIDINPPTLLVRLTKLREQLRLGSLLNPPVETPFPRKIVRFRSFSVGSRSFPLVSPQKQNALPWTPQIALLT